MYLAVVALHIILCVVLVFVILLQPGKNGDVGASFGGSGGNIFGPRGPTSLLARVTTVVAIMFMVTSVTLAWFSNKEILANSNVMDAIDLEQQKQKANDAKAAEEAQKKLDETMAPVPTAPTVPESAPTGLPDPAAPAAPAPGAPTAPASAPAAPTP